MKKNRKIKVTAMLLASALIGASCSLDATNLAEGTNTSENNDTSASTDNTEQSADDSVLHSNTTSSKSRSSANITPKEADYGYYVTATKDGSSDNLNSTEVIKTFLKLWTPGENWYDGVKENASVLNENITKSYQIAAARTAEEEAQAVTDDLNDQTYSMFEGLEEYRDTYLKGIGSSDNTLNDQWSYDSSSSLADIENLVKIVRNNNASTSPAKKYYKYPRPFRWNLTTGEVINEKDEDGNYKVAEGQVASELVSRIKADPSNDGGFPSGHTNAAYLTSIALAYAVPQKYDALILRAGKLGYNRVVAGMHSPLDVMGGRMTATAVAANALYRDTNLESKAAAYAKAQSSLIGDDWTSSAATASDYETYKANLATYNEYSTFSFTKTGTSGAEMTVPMGAEVLLETRFPYLDDTQRRWILHSTGFDSGYPVLDDTEGWGRLNLYKACHGYASFDSDVTVNMDSSEGGFFFLDNWMNDIDGNGGLVKTGSGTLVLAGNNSYEGSTTVTGGTLTAASKTAFGKGNLIISSGCVDENVDGEVDVEGNYIQSAGQLTVGINSSDDVLKISGSAVLDGDLVIDLEDGFEPSSMTVIEYSSYSGKFSTVTVNVSGTESSDYKVYYTKKGITIRK